MERVRVKRMTRVIQNRPARTRAGVRPSVATRTVCDTAVWCAGLGGATSCGAGALVQSSSTRFAAGEGFEVDESAVLRHLRGEAFAARASGGACAANAVAAR